MSGKFHWRSYELHPDFYGYSFAGHINLDPADLLEEMQELTRVEDGTYSEFATPHYFIATP